ncbi:helix-turn-helix transcriptional regulator [Spirosoma rigui]|uniref:helix-turn-helix transcriptional regulator n=1 Tax=Spirosoma rigui TaxID=564064 RepID=UPI0009AFBC26|nr:helix-turn-helix transcriptional regulator [Spirosoma rigui]
MNINDKIKQILIDKNLTPSYFADEIGVQRSSISHILSGRNRPSFDIIQKIIRRFPELGYEWIMEEEQQPQHQANQSNYGSPRNSPSVQPVDRREQRYPVSPSVSYTAPSIHVRSQRNEIPPVMQSVNPASVDHPVLPEPTGVVGKADKKIDRILIFFTDGSFQEYGPTA